MVDRIASFSNTTQLITNNLRVESEYAENQLKLSSGLKSDTYEGLDTDVNQLLNLESDYKQIITQTEVAQTALDRTQASYSALTGIIDLAQNFAADLNAAISSTGLEEDELASLAQSNLESTASSLNTQVAGRYIFAGSATQTAPVDLDDTSYGGQIYTAPGPSVSDTNYYQGNDYIQSVEVSDGFTVDYGVTADDASIEEIMRAYDLIRTSAGDPDTLNEALALIQSGIDSLSSTQANIAQSSQVLDQKIDEGLEEVNLLDGMISNIKEVDLAEVTVKIQELEAQLEASYSVTADLLRLNLTDYI